jgi:hypothetical protein
MTLTLYLLAAAMIFVLLWYVYWVIKDSWIVYKNKRREKLVGMRKAYRQIFEEIRYAVHPASLYDLQDRSLDFKSNHNGEMECEELFLSLMAEIRRKEIQLVTYKAYSRV